MRPHLVLRRLIRRPRFTVALVALAVLLTGLTGAVIGGLAWLEQRSQSRALVDAAMAQAAGLVADHIVRVFHGAESLARLGPQLVAAGQLDPDDGPDLERFVTAALRAHPDLTWVSYGDRRDRFVGAWRDAAGALYLNRSFPVGRRIRLEEDRLQPDGRRQPVRRSDDHGYRPSERPFFQAAAAGGEVTWTGPYQFFAGGPVGVTCGAPVRAAGGGVRGVFTVDFSLERLADVLDAVQVSPRGRAFLATAEGALLLGQRRAGREPGREAALVSAAAVHARLGTATAFEFQQDGERYLGRIVPLGGRGPGWLVAVIVPEGDYTDRVDRQARRTAGLGLLALLAAVGAGILLARWIGRPLRDLADAARRIRQGQLDVSLTPRSTDEIGVLTRAMAEMARALRDRAFVRETLGRYVSPEVAERLLRDREAIRLGGEVREVAILMSDLRDFSDLSERLGPEAMIALLNRYLAAMTPVILDHEGVIDEFIGDAILVLFGAPFQRPDDPERAVRCARAMQQALAAMNAESRQRGLPELAMGIAVHVGTVVAGNIGSRDRVKYGVVGPPVNLTARLQAAAGPGEVLLSEALAARVGRLVRLGPARVLQVKGSAAPVTVYPLQGLVAAAPDPTVPDGGPAGPVRPAGQPAAR